MLLEISGEITPERMKGWSQSKNNTKLWMISLRIGIYINPIYVYIAVLLSSFIYIYISPNQFAVHQKLTKYCISTILQFKERNIYLRQNKKRERKR